MLKRLNFDGKGIWWPFTMLAVLTVAWHLIAYTILRRKKQTYMKVEKPSREMAVDMELE